jgi:hypothetical protein
VIADQMDDEQDHAQIEDHRSHPMTGAMAAKYKAMAMMIA